MILKRFSFTLLPLLPLLLIACKPNDPEPIGGKGGNATLLITPYHHTRMIDSLKVYIKYDAQEKPATYDDSAVCVPMGGKAVATFQGLRKGKYYLYGYGWDPSIGQNVKGGIPYTITDESVLSLNLPVTED